MNDPDRTSSVPAPIAATSAADMTAELSSRSSFVDGGTAAFAPDEATEPMRSEPERASDSVPGYEIEKILGRGGMGVVYKARHLTLKRIVALKMVLAGGHAGPHELARFRIEAEAVARLQHPNIVQIHEVGEAGGHPYFALEFVEGGNLAGKLGGKPIPAKEAARLVESLARAMQLAHSRNVVHRDLKPANILLTTDGTPKITDFGLARQMDSDSGETQAGAVMGTPSYMAPEQASGRAHEAGPPADVYALGAILYDCLAGRPPFKGKSIFETLDQVRTQEPAPPSQYQAGVPLDLETICLKCLHKEPEKRYASAAELADELVRYQRGEPILARPVGNIERVWRWCVRKPALASMAFGLAAVIVGAFAVVVWQLNVTTAALAREENAKQQRALAQVNALCSAIPGAVPGILADLEANRGTVLPRLRERYAEEANQAKRMRLALALLPIEPDKVRDELTAWMLQADDPSEVLVVRDALLPRAAELTENLWLQAEAPKPRAERFRALVALGTFDPASPRWDAVAPDVVEELLSANPLRIGSWVQALRPVRKPLLSSFVDVFKGKRLSEHRQVAATVLADFAADQPQVLADLLMDADEKQFAVIYPTFKAQGERGVSLLIVEIDKKLPPDLPSSDDQRETLAKRQANAAVALLKMNQPAKVWPLLKRSPPDDPRLRSYLIHRLSPLRAEAGAIIKRLGEEPDVTIRRVLLLSLGEFGERELPADARASLLPKLQDIYRNDRDPGLHAAAEWLLRQWKQDDWLNQLNDQWTQDKEGRNKRLESIQQLVEKAKEKTPPQWYVNAQGQTMVVIPGPVQFLMGSPSTEAGRQEVEPQHQRRIGRSFALAAEPVTVREFQRFLRENGLEKQFDSGGQAAPVLKKYSPDENCPIILLDWYNAAVYCNWLSKQEGIREEQWCYETDKQGTVTALKAKYLSLQGYRLPTEAEWEYACRAGAVTSWYYGETEELLPQYGWYTMNSGQRSRPVGSKKPNDLGLFDMHGNVFTWCQEAYRPYYRGPNDGVVVEDKEDVLSIEATATRILRGGSFGFQAPVVRSALRLRNVPGSRYSYVGVRPAKTFVP